ncbi:hypothetical protein [Dactylosporangium salmoneum]|uniref:Uncharacterized protein n=1 Tax=Dactylosporangium salmoneum TaxID=53361 RepID=A0ABN3FCX3_9ACTN
MLKLGELVAFLKADDSDLERGLDRGERRFDRFGRHVDDVVEHAAATAGAAGERGGQLFAEGLFRDHNGRLHDSLGRFVAESAVAGEQAGQQAGSQLFSGLQRWFDKLTVSDIPFMGLVKVIAALAAVALFAGPAVFTLGGALGSLPALASGAGAAIATLLIGFVGLGDAFKKTASSGQSAADKAYQVAVAQRNLTLATRDAAEASEAVNRAREDEIERLEDLARAQAHASNDQKKATRAVAEAEKALARARAGGNGDKINEAQEALEDAKLNLADVRDRVEDLGKERAKADRDGVEGSDQVQAALKRQEQATYALEDAQHSLDQARRSGAGGAAAALTKISASAQATVDAIKSLKAQWEDLRLSTQERLFKGVPSEIKASAKAWFQPLKDELGRYADTYNAIFKTGASTTRTPEFIHNTMIGLESVRGLIDRVGKAVGGPFMRAWGQLSAASAPFVDMLGTKLAGAITNFSNWIDKADKSGKLSSFFKESAFYLSQIWDITGDVIKISGQLFAIWTGTENRKADDSALQGLKKSLEGFSEWLKDPQNQAQVAQFIDNIHSSFNVMIEVLKWLDDTGIPTARKWISEAEEWKNTVSGWIDTVKGWKTDTSDAIDTIKGKVGEVKDLLAKTSLFGPVREEARSVLNFIIDGWNRLRFAIPGADLGLLGHFGGTSLGVAPIKRLAAGGTLVSDGLVHIAEHSTEGITLPLPKGAQVQPLAPGWRNGGGGGQISGQITLVGTGLLAGLRETVAIRGGRVEAVIGA